MPWSDEPQIKGRVVKLCARFTGGKSKFKYSTGFVLRSGVILTCAHGVAGADSVDVTTVHDMTRTIDMATAAIKTPPAHRGSVPDLALLFEDIGLDLPSFPLGLIQRDDPPLDTLQAHVVGFPYFVEGDVRNPFHDEGRLPLLDDVGRGLITVNLLADPPALDPNEDLESQWEGISGSPVIVDGRLTAVVIQHVGRAGTARLTAIPLSLVDPSGSGEADDWWRALSLGSPDDIPWLPRSSQSVRWLDLIRSVAEAAEGLPRRESRRLGEPRLFAEPLHVLLRDSFDEADYSLPRAIEIIRAALERETAPTEQITYILQLDRRLTREALRSALGQLRQLDQQLAMGDARGLDLHYRIAAPVLGVEDWRAALVEWASMSAGATDATDLIARVDITDTPDARGQLVATLADRRWGIRDPQRFCDDIISQIVDETFGSEDSIQALAGSIGHELDVRGAMVTQYDTLPSSVEYEAEGFLLNEQPTLAHLRHGDVARLNELDDIESQYWAFYDRYLSASNRRSSRIPMFWITGPSGAGKSIALIELLAQLSRRSGVTSIAWDQASAGLSRVVEQAATLSTSRHVIIAVDDPNSVNSGSAPSAWRSAFDVLLQARQQGDLASLPVFLCCSPTDQYGRFHQSHVAEIFDATFRLDPYRPEFIAQLVTWYRARTGRVATVRSGSETRLPAQLFFEWWKDEAVAPFARRFRERVEAASLTGFFDRLFAANRLYVGYPERALERLTAAQRDHLNQFVEDLHVAKDLRLSRPGYWFSHPHLANLIYESWHPVAESGHRRMSHLAGALVEASSIPGEEWRESLPLLRRLSELVDPTEDEPTRLSRDEIRGILREAKTRLENSTHDCCDDVLALWVHIDGQLGPEAGAWDPHLVAVDRLQHQSATTPLLMALATSEDDAVTAEVWSFLKGNLELDDWFVVAGALARRPVPDDALAVVVNALDTGRDRPGHLELVQLLVHHVPPVRVIARAMLGSVSVDDGTSLLGLAREMCRLGGADAQAVIDWLTKHNSPDDGVVYEEFLSRQTYPANLQPLVKSWVQRYPEEPAAAVGFRRLLIWPRMEDDDFRRSLSAHLTAMGDGADTVLIEAIVEKLGQRHPRWPYLFTALGPTQVRLPAIREIAIVWLDSNREGEAWHRVFTHLAEASVGEDAMLVDHALRHLEAGGCRHCGWMFQSLEACTPTHRRHEVATAGLRWLETNSDNATAASIVVQALVPIMSHAQLSISGPALVALWKQHRECETHLQAHLGAALLRSLPEPSLTELMDDARSWLASDRVGWGAVYLQWSRHSSVGAARDVAVKWLHGHPADDRWNAVFSVVIDVIDQQTAADLTKLWFAQRSLADRGAGYVWGLVIENGPCSDLVRDHDFRRIVAQWLMLNASRQSWWHIFREIYLADLSDVTIISSVLQMEEVGDRQFGVCNLVTRTLIAHPEIAESLWRVMESSPRTSLWQLMWLHIVGASPTQTGWQLGIATLPNLEASRFSAWWRRLWNTYQETSQRSQLRTLARPWLAENEGTLPAAKVQRHLDLDPVGSANPMTVFGRMAPRAGGHQLRYVTVTPASRVAAGPASTPSVRSKAEPRSPSASRVGLPVSVVMPSADTPAADSTPAKE